MTMTQLRKFDGMPNPQDQAPVWVRVTLTVGKTLTRTVKLDWNNRAAQRAFAEYADGVIRAGGMTEVRAIE